MEIVKDIIQQTNDKTLTDKGNSEKVNSTTKRAKNAPAAPEIHQNIQSRPNIIS